MFTISIIVTITSVGGFSLRGVCTECEALSRSYTVHNSFPAPSVPTAESISRALTIDNAILAEAIVITDSNSRTYTLSNSFPGAVFVFDESLSRSQTLCISPFAGLGDLDCDAQVNLADFTTFAICFGLQANWCHVADFNKDGHVNLVDFSTLANHFGVQAE